MQTMTVSALTDKYRSRDSQVGPTPIGYIKVTSHYVSNKS